MGIRLSLSFIRFSVPRRRTAILAYFWNQTFFSPLKWGTTPRRYTAKWVDTPEKMYATSSKSKRFIKGCKSLKKMKLEQRQKQNKAKHKACICQFFCFVYPFLAISMPSCLLSSIVQTALRYHPGFMLIFHSPPTDCSPRSQPADSCSCSLHLI